MPVHPTLLLAYIVRLRPVEISAPPLARAPEVALRVLVPAMAPAALVLAPSAFRALSGLSREPLPLPELPDGDELLRRQRRPVEAPAAQLSVHALPARRGAPRRHRVRVDAVPACSGPPVDGGGAHEASRRYAFPVGVGADGAPLVLIVYLTHVGRID